MQVRAQPRRQLARRRRAVRLDALDDGQRGRRPAADHDLDRVRQPVEDRAPLRSSASACLRAGGVQVDRRHAIDGAHLEAVPDRHVHHAVGDAESSQVRLVDQAQRLATRYAFTTRQKARNPSASASSCRGGSRRQVTFRTTFCARNASSLSAPCSAGGSSQGSANGVASTIGSSPSHRPTSPSSRRPSVATGAPSSSPLASTT